MSVINHTLKTKLDAYDVDCKTSSIQHWISNCSCDEAIAERIFIVLTPVPSECAPEFPLMPDHKNDSLFILSCRSSDIDPFFSTQFSKLRSCLQKDTSALCVCLLDVPLYSQAAPVAKLKTLITPGSVMRISFFTHRSSHELSHALTVGHSICTWIQPQLVSALTSFQSYILHRILAEDDPNFEKITVCTMCQAQIRPRHPPCVIAQEYQDTGWTKPSQKHILRCSINYDCVPMWPPNDEYPFKLNPSQIAYMKMYRQRRINSSKRLEIPIDAQMNIGPYCPTTIPITIYTIPPARTSDSDKTAGQVAYCARPELSSPNQFKEVFT